MCGINISAWLGCEGVKQIRVSLLAQKADVDYRSDVISADDIVQHIIKFGFGASLLESDVNNPHGSVDLQVNYLLTYTPHFLHTVYTY